MSAPIVMVDVGLGNLRSVERALLASLGPDLQVVMSDDPGRVREAGIVVVPGQGAFGDCSVALSRHGASLRRALTDHITAGRPYLGICLGLQVLFETSEEAPGRTGLGIFPGAVRRLAAGVDDDGERVKVPHMGWNTARAVNDGARWIDDGAWYYFVHSFAVEPEDPSLVAGVTHHGRDFACAVARGNLLGVQFHPEKSQRAGLALLRRWFEAMGALA